MGQEQAIAMGNCNHEEADTRMVVHLINALENGLNSIVVCTVDTDVIVILISEFHTIQEVHPEADILIAFGTGKNIRYYHTNTVCGNLGRDKSFSACISCLHRLRHYFFLPWQDKEICMGSMEFISRGE